jgi:uncharacterized membrane protein YheB (UPF0754 family)
MNFLKNPSVSLLINSFLMCCIILGYLVHPEYGVFLKTLGLYGLSGSITNSLAIIMIFHKIPWIVGSGIIEKNFNLFKKKLKETLMIHLFSSGLEIKSWDIEALSSQLYERLQTSNMSIVTQFISKAHLSNLLKEIDLSFLLNQAISHEQLDLFLENQINKLSPQQVKELLNHILDEHLQWLVFWGAVFGIVFGLASFVIVF